MPHIIRKPGILGGTTLAVFMTLASRPNEQKDPVSGAFRGSGGRI
jgi:hypothetical protein